MKIVWYICLLIGIAVGLVWMSLRDAEAERNALARQHQRLLEEEERARKDAEERKVQKEKEIELKNNAVKMLQAYIGREEIRLNKIIEEANINVERIELDKKDLSEAIAEVEKKNEKIAEEYRRKKIPRFDKAERVSLMFKDATIKSIAEKYLGDDLSALYAKYKSEVNTILKIYREESAGLRANREEYCNSVKGVDEELDARNMKARKHNSRVIRMAEMEIKLIEKQKRPLEKELEILIRQTGGMASGFHQRRIAELKNKIEVLEDRLRPARTQLATVVAQSAHMDATESETMVRRKYNRAQEVKDQKDNEVHQQSRHEADMYQIAMRYEADTLDKIRSTMKTVAMIERSRASDAQEKLEFMRHTSANVDLLNVEEIETIRVKIVEKISSEFSPEESKHNQE